MATLGLSKVFILDKYFTELQKFWETEKKLQGKWKLQMSRKLNLKIIFLYFKIIFSKLGYKSVEFRAEV